MKTPSHKKTASDGSISLRSVTSRDETKPAAARRKPTDRDHAPHRPSLVPSASQHSTASNRSTTSANGRLSRSPSQKPAPPILGRPLFQATESPGVGAYAVRFPEQVLVGGSIPRAGSESPETRRRASTGVAVRADRHRHSLDRQDGIAHLQAHIQELEEDRNAWEQEREQLLSQVVELGQSLQAIEVAGSDGTQRPKGAVAVGQGLLVSKLSPASPQHPPGSIEAVPLSELNAEPDELRTPKTRMEYAVLQYLILTNSQFENTADVVMQVLFLNDCDVAGQHVDWPWLRLQLAAKLHAEIDDAEPSSRGGGLKEMLVPVAIGFIAGLALAWLTSRLRRAS
eukprot:TRINITY_DN3322_c0_g2_i1.p1 TRINITY_DN3322_c0_g2~~TRINITY_DN3322_c0_g2_i1.p1  ORF type:complete len:341 (+),score=63.35 TRINITY_DN3322_c0_g2_i1:165-1187(+)